MIKRAVGWGGPWRRGGSPGAAGCPYVSDSSQLCLRPPSVLRLQRRRCRSRAQTRRISVPPAVASRWKIKSFSLFLRQVASESNLIALYPVTATEALSTVTINPRRFVSLTSKFRPSKNLRSLCCFPVNGRASATVAVPTGASLSGRYPGQARITPPPLLGFNIVAPLFPATSNSSDALSRRK